MTAYHAGQGYALPRPAHLTGVPLDISIEHTFCSVKEQFSVRFLELVVRASDKKRSTSSTTGLKAAHHRTRSSGTIPISLKTTSLRQSSLPESSKSGSKSIVDKRRGDRIRPGYIRLDRNLQFVAIIRHVDRVGRSGATPKHPDTRSRLPSRSTGVRRPADRDRAQRIRGRRALADHPDL